MTEQTLNNDLIERSVADYFNREAGQAPVPGDLWHRVRARLMQATARPRLRSRLWPLPALGFATTFAVVAIAAGMWAVVGGTGSTPPDDEMRNAAVGPAGRPGPLAFPTPMPAAPTPTPAPPSGLFIAGPDVIETPGPQPAPTTIDGQATGRSIVSTATVGIEVEAVRPAMDRVRTIAEGLGGFVEQLSTSGGPEPRQGNATVRIPGAEFFTALDAVKSVGKVLSEQVGTDDVTTDLIDLEARLRGEQAKEASLIELLERANSVSDVLSVERELSRVRTEIERLEGQLSFIKRRVDLATLHVSLSVPVQATGQAPAASLAVRTKDVEGRVAEARTIVLQAEGKVLSTSISQRQDGLNANIALEVPVRRFDDVVAGLERLGNVVSKDVFQEGASPDATDEDDSSRARITLTLSTPEPAARNWWLLAGVPAGGVAAILILGLSLYAAYRVGRRGA